MSKSTPLLIVDNESERNAVVLTIASPSRNTVTQLYDERVQVSRASIESLSNKISDKLRLHRINNVQSKFSIQFSNDRTLVIDSLEKFSSLDAKIECRTQILNIRFSFVFDPDGMGDEHLHSIQLRIAERPNPGVIFQRFLSTRSEDHDSLDGDAFATVSCRIDFLESRFSSELLNVVSEWVKSLPRAEPVFPAVRWLQRKCDRVTEFIYGTFPPLVVLSSTGIWMGYLPSWMNSSIKIGVAWILLSAALFLTARYLAISLNRSLERNLDRICNVPVFQITAGDDNRLTAFLAKSKSSLYKVAFNGLIYGVFKGIGLFLVGKLIVRLL